MACKASELDHHEEGRAGRALKYNGESCKVLDLHSLHHILCRLHMGLTIFLAIAAEVMTFVTITIGSTCAIPTLNLAKEY